METATGKADEAGTGSQECWEGEAVGTGGTRLLHVACYFRSFSLLWRCCQFSQKTGPNDIRLPNFLQAQV